MSNIYIENLIKNNMRLLRLCEDDPDTSRVKLDAVQSKVLEYLRQIQVRCPVPLPGGEVCKINICIQLACAKLGIPVDKKRCQEITTQSEKVYNDSLNRVMMVLGLERVVDIHELCVKFGVECLVNDVPKALEKYKRRIVKTVGPDFQKDMKFNSPMMITAMLYVVAKKFKVFVVVFHCNGQRKIDRRALMDVAGTSDWKAFESIVNQIETTLAIDNYDEAIIKPPTSEVQPPTAPQEPARTAPAEPVRTDRKRPVDDEDLSAELEQLNAQRLKSASESCKNKKLVLELVPEVCEPVPQHLDEKQREPEKAVENDKQNEQQTEQNEQTEQQNEQQTEQQTEQQKEDDDEHVLDSYQTWKQNLLKKMKRN